MSEKWSKTSQLIHSFKNLYSAPSGNHSEALNMVVAPAKSETIYIIVKNIDQKTRPQHYFRNYLKQKIIVGRYMAIIYYHGPHTNHVFQYFRAGLGKQ